jgi:transposase
MKKAVTVGVVEPLELRELETRIAEGHEAVLAGASAALVAALKVGADLLRARELVPRGEWEQWMEARCPFSVFTGHTYMRLAYHRQVLGDVRAMSVKQARELLTGYPPIPGTTRLDDRIREEAHRLRAKGLSNTAISARLDVPRSTIGDWLSPAHELRRKKAAQRRKRKAERTARTQELTLSRARARKDSLGRSYVTIRLAAVETDKARSELRERARRHVGKARASLERAADLVGEALSHVYRAEDEATAAVRCEAPADLADYTRTRDVDP